MFASRAAAPLSARLRSVVACRRRASGGLASFFPPLSASSSSSSSPRAAAATTSVGASPNKSAAAAATTMTVRDALNSALDEELARDEMVILMGEEVGAYNGAYKVSKGLFDKYGENRVRDTPITEHGFTGIGVGASLYGVRPIVEFMTWNFAMQAMDQIVNSAAKVNYMSAGDLTGAIVFRGPNGPPRGVGAQHSQCFAAWLSSVPGLKVVAPYSAEDARGLLKAAIRDNDPVCVLENEILYNKEFAVSAAAMDADYVLPIGVAHVERVGRDVTLVSFSRGVDLALEAATMLADEGIDAEVINLRSVRPLDIGTVLESVKKTHRVVTIEEGWRQCGVGAEIVARLMEVGGFDQLDAPVERVTSADVPMPYAKNLEDEAMADAHNVVNAAKRVLYRK